ncbi:MAG TPA: hypothetical protein VH280_18225 [Verrucomicrobiae bacterium]|jgi:hypothetical protein|nr:hypothetical protein [Verrucomicrobiae bacterium]
MSQFQDWLLEGGRMKTKEVAVIWRKLAPSFQGLGLVIKGRFVFISPVGDFVRGVYFEEAFDSTAFYLRVLFLPLFVPQECISFIHGERIGDNLLWKIENPDLIDNLRAVIQTQALPFLESVSTLAGVIACVEKDVERGWPRYNSHHMEELAYLCIKNGDHSEALKWLRHLQRDLENETTPWIIDQRNRTRLIETKLLESPEAALNQFEDWKKQTIITLGLEKYAGAN